MLSAAANKTYGTVAAERRKEMSGGDFVRGLVEGTLPLNTIARTLGYDVSEVTTVWSSPRHRPTRCSTRPARAWRFRGDTPR